jgi:hypothetical protein
MGEVIDFASRVSENAELVFRITEPLQSARADSLFEEGIPFINNTIIPMLSPSSRKLRLK